MSEAKMGREIGFKTFSSSLHSCQKCTAFRANRIFLRGRASSFNSRGFGHMTRIPSPRMDGWNERNGLKYVLVMF